MAQPDRSFAQLVSLACHDLRTPLATVSGFAKTLTRMEGVEEQLAQYLGMIEAASGQLAGLLDELGLAARIENGLWEPLLRERDSLELAHAAAASVAEAEVAVSGAGAQVAVPEDVGERALAGLARCALRHGGGARLTLVVEGPNVTYDPVPEPALAICLGRELRDLSAAVAVRVLAACGGRAEPEGETLVVRLPLAPVVG